MLEAKLILSGSDQIEQMILKRQKFFLGRLGSVEAELLYRQLQFDSGIRDLKEFKKSGIRMRKEAWISAGIWPPSSKQIRLFNSAYIEALGNVTTIASWGATSLKFEEEILNRFCSNIPRIPLGSLDPVLVGASNGKAWTLALDGMNILIISSFAKEIIQQYRKVPLHSEIILPKFNLRTLKPPQTNGITLSQNNWTNNLKSFNITIKREIELHHIDVVLVAAGSYGMPISNSIFQNGTSVIYIGGALQLIFGIWGSRWEHSVEVNKMANKNWIWPSKTTKPRGAFLIEKSCYW